MTIAVLIFLVLIAILQAIDTEMTVRGISHGFEEGNWIIRGIFGPKPKGWQIVLVNVLTLFGCASPAIFSQNVGLWGLGMGLLTGLAARHVYGIYEWRKAGV
jgi:hypothetical protein